MKRLVHIPILLVTLLWVIVPHSVADNAQHQRENHLRALSDENSQVILPSLSGKIDTRIELSSAPFLPEAAESEFRYHSKTENEPRDFAAFIISHFLYTQVTSSYL